MPHRIHPIFQNDYITVTDLPQWAGADINAYHYLPADARAVSDYQQAGAGLLNADRDRTFWQRLANRVRIARVARCHGCAAYAARTLFEADFHTNNNMHIWICGRGDHYFVVLSDSPRVIATSLMHFNTAIFNNTDIVVDLWLYNLCRQQDGQLSNDAMAVTVPNFQFIQNQTDISIFVRYYP
jgi:hypothetical protein